jgi:hypothetical protein
MQMISTWLPTLGPNACLLAPIINTKTCQQVHARLQLEHRPANPLEASAPVDDDASALDALCKTLPHVPKRDKKRKHKLSCAAVAHPAQSSTLLMQVTHA